MTYTMTSTSKTQREGQLRKDILAKLATVGSSTVYALSYELDKSPHQIGMILKRMVKDGELTKQTHKPPRHSEYRIPPMIQ